MIIKLIEEAVYSLLSQRVYEYNIIIAISPLTERMLKKELYELSFYSMDKNEATKMFGCEIYYQHFNNNEIVVYDKTDWSRERKVIIKLEIN